MGIFRMGRVLSKENIPEMTLIFKLTFLVMWFAGSELKRRLKADKKAKEKAEKSTTAAAAAAIAASEPSQSIKEMEDIDPNVS